MIKGIADVTRSDAPDRSVAYAVRKAIMDESIYTMKLRARRHSVPQSLHASLRASERIERI